MNFSTAAVPLMQVLLGHLDDEDDPALWQAAVDHILAEFEEKPNSVIEIGRCSHWLRPHQTRWTADGGFAWPTGYGGTTQSRNGLPLFDWSVIVQWSDDKWVPRAHKATVVDLRITIPSRTTRHRQAALHTLWKTGRRSKERRFYGFRKKEGKWECTAETEWAVDRREARRRNKHRA